MQNYELKPDKMGGINHEDIFQNITENHNPRSQIDGVQHIGGSPDAKANEAAAGQEIQAGRQNQLMNCMNSRQNMNKTEKNVVTEEMKKGYEEIFNNYGAEVANNWMKQQIVGNQLKVQMENEAVCLEIQQKYAEIYANPIVKEAIEAYMAMDLDPEGSLKEQGLDVAVDYISSIYKAGYEAGASLKAQNDTAKSRMASSVSGGNIGVNSGRPFTRQEIKAMDAETFLRNEKAIFDQLQKGLIK